MNDVRKCSRCQIEKQITEFYVGERSHCKECERVDASSRMRRYSKTLRGKASQALQTSRKTIKQNGYDVKDDLTLMDVIWVFATSNNTCEYCGKETADLELDHIVPLSRNGPNTFSNLISVCSHCNRSKSNRDLLKWRELDVVVGAIEKMASRRGVPVEEVLEELTP